MTFVTAWPEKGITPKITPLSGSTPAPTLGSFHLTRTSHPGTGMAQRRGHTAQWLGQIPRGLSHSDRGRPVRALRANLPTTVDHDATADRRIGCPTRPTGSTTIPPRYPVTHGVDPARYCLCGGVRRRQLPHGTDPPPRPLPAPCSHPRPVRARGISRTAGPFNATGWLTYI